MGKLLLTPLPKWVMTVLETVLALCIMAGASWAYSINGDMKQNVAHYEYLNSKLIDLRSYMDPKFDAQDKKFDKLEDKIDKMNELLMHMNMKRN